MCESIDQIDESEIVFNEVSEWIAALNEDWSIMWKLARLAGEASKVKQIPWKAPRVFIRESSSGSLYWTTDALNEWRRMTP